MPVGEIVRRLCKAWPLGGFLPEITGTGCYTRGRVVVVCFSEISISMFFLSSEYLNEVANLQKVSTGFIIDFIVELM